MGLIVGLTVGAAFLAALAFAIDGKEKVAWMTFAGTLLVVGMGLIVMALYTGVIGGDYLSGAFLGMLGVVGFLGTFVILGAASREVT